MSRTVTFRKCAENIVTTVTFVTSQYNQEVEDDDTDDDIAVSSENIVIAPEAVVTICEGDDDTAGRDDGIQTYLSSSSKKPSHNGLGEVASTGDDDDDIFAVSSERCVIDVGATADGPLPEYIVTSAQLDAVLPALCAALLLAVDIETTGLDPLKDRIRLIQFALPDRVVVVDAGTCPVPQLSPVFAASHPLAFHNAKFDLKFLHAAGLPWPEAPVFDTMLAAQLLGAGTAEGQLKQCGLAAVARRYLGLELDKALQTSDWSGTLTPA
jgi:hypothetical protein